MSGTLEHKSVRVVASNPTISPSSQRQVSEAEFSQDAQDVFCGTDFPLCTWQVSAPTRKSCAQGCEHLSMLASCALAMPSKD